MTLDLALRIAAKMIAQCRDAATTFRLLAGITVIAALGKMTNQQGSATCRFRPVEQTATFASDPVMATLQIRSTLDTRMPTSSWLDALRLTVGCMP